MLLTGDADCYDAVTVVMGAVLVVMAIVMMGGAVYIDHCLSLIGSISVISGSCRNCCTWFLSGPWVLRKERTLLKHGTLSEGVLLGPLHDFAAVCKQLSAHAVTCLQPSSNVPTCTAHGPVFS